MNNDKAQKIYTIKSVNNKSVIVYVNGGQYITTIRHDHTQALINDTVITITTPRGKTVQYSVYGAFLRQF